MNIAAESFQALLDLLYPPKCLVCGEDGMDIFCSACKQAIPKLNPPYCRLCGSPAIASYRLCEFCIKGGRKPYYASIAVGQYGGPLRKAVHLLKYDGYKALATPLGELMALALEKSRPELSLQEKINSIDLIVPAPLHPVRKQERGYNQAELLAAAISAHIGIPIEPEGLKRTHWAGTQTRLGRAERSQNVQNAFYAPSSERIAGRNILLVDDVLTTEATVMEAAYALKASGAASIMVAAAARDI